MVDQAEDNGGHCTRCADDGVVPQATGRRLIHHSDRGSQYASHAFQGKLTESFFNSLKNERGPGARYTTREDARADLFDYIEVFYNRSRRHSTLGYHSPVQFLQDWITNQHEREITA